ncbi:probable transmembrane ascorbate ferrireductase 4 [Phalaenopsis equestris]|uniref:probable transmembrane ascorbate ferrireductase 4 n=1 Tax=Phalaenopsis equestris TaxID=78828 RepID=UPI0009E326C9|nr:probable transmembrane ascorbate ferrireductase 4 [Phalaenopsis equestris]
MTYSHLTSLRPSKHTPPWNHVWAHVRAFYSFIFVAVVDFAGALTTFHTFVLKLQSARSAVELKACVSREEWGGFSPSQGFGGSSSPASCSPGRSTTNPASYRPPPPSSTAAAGTISQLDHIYSFLLQALHPLLMVIGFILLNGEAILVLRRPAGQSPESRKAVQLSLQAVGLGFGLFGIWAKFSGKDGISSNFFSLHSWIGLACVALFASQWAMGFISMWHKPQERSTRSTILPWHTFVGLYTFGLAVAAAETGLQEKLTFLLDRRGLARNSREAFLINSLGLALALLALVVVLAAISPRHQVGQVTKFVNFKDDMNRKFHV